MAVLNENWQAVSLRCPNSAQMHRIDTDYAHSCLTGVGAFDAEAAWVVAQTASPTAARRTVVRSRLPSGGSALFPGSAHCAVRQTSLL